MLCGPAAKSASSRSIRAGCRHSNVLQSPTRARHNSASDLRWIRVMEIQASEGFTGAAASSVAGFGASDHRSGRSDFYRRYEPRARLRSHSSPTTRDRRRGSVRPFEAFGPEIAHGVSVVLLRELSRRLSSPSGQLALLSFLADRGSRQAFKRSKAAK